jgi:crossover junction endodeoxyribonuclease RuvC
MKLYLGCDPGLDGCLAVLDETGKFLFHFDTPSLEYKSGKKKRRRYNIPEMVNIVTRCTDPADDFVITMEQVGAMPGNGSASMFSMGRGVGTWEGIFTTVCIVRGRGRMQYVTPQRWKKLMLDGLDKSSKDSSRLKASQLWPQADLSLKKYDGRADALLIAEYGRKTFNTSDNGHSDE